MMSTGANGSDLPPRVDERDRRTAHRVGWAATLRRAGLQVPLAAAVLSAVLIVPMIAHAASSAPALKSLSWSMRVLQDGRQGVFVTGELPDSTPLPAKVVIPIPGGDQPDWVGEIVGTDPSKDPTATYTVDQATGYGVLTITVKTARVAQAEFITPAAAAGTDLVLAGDMPILGPVEDATLSLEPPSGSSVTTATPGLIKTTAGGSDTYTIVKRSPAVGTVLAGSLTAVLRASGGAPGQSATATGTQGGGGASLGGGNPAAILVATLLTVAVGFGLYAAWANRGRLTSLLKRSAAGETAPDTQASRPPAKGQRVKPAAVGAASKPKPNPEPGPEPRPKPRPKPKPTPRPAPKPNPKPEPTPNLKPEPAPEPADEAGPGPAGATGHDLVLLVKDLASLRTGGLLSPDEYGEAKRTLLSGDAHVVTLLKEVAGFSVSALLTPDEFTAIKEHLLTGSAEIVTEIEDLVALNTEGLLSREEFQSVVDRLLGA